jgi:hypothetical protein
LRAVTSKPKPCIATISRIHEERARAARLFGAAEALRERIGIPMTPLERQEYDHEISDLRAGMDPKVFGAEWEQGRALTMEDAIRFAVKSNQAG